MHASDGGRCKSSVVWSEVTAVKYVLDTRGKYCRRYVSVVQEQVRTEAGAEEMTDENEMVEGRQLVFVEHNSIPWEVAL